TAAAIQQNLLIIPGSVFSERHTHFRISYAAADATIERGIDILNRLAKRLFAWAENAQQFQ
ncbi:MAG: hypothetical protein AABY76_06440, partial [Planctomycetota bacterium]